MMPDSTVKKGVGKNPLTLPNFFCSILLSYDNGKLFPKHDDKVLLLLEAPYIKAYKKTYQKQV